MGAASGAGRTRRGHGVDALRTGQDGVCVDPPDDGGPGEARRRPDRGAAAELRPGGRARPRASRARALRRVSPRGAADRRRDQILRERGHARRARARRGGAARAHPFRRRAGADRARVSLPRALAGADRNRARHPRCGVRPRGIRAAEQDRVRPGPAELAAFRLARRKQGRPLCVPALAVLGAEPPERRLSRGPTPRSRRRRSRACGGGDDSLARRAAAAGAGGTSLGADAARCRRRPRGLDASGCVRAGGAACRRAVAAGHPCSRRGHATPRRAARLEPARRHAVARGGRRGARPCGGSPLVHRRAGTYLGARSPARADTAVPDRVPARVGGRKPSAPRPRVSLPRRRHAA